MTTSRSGKEHPRVSLVLASLCAALVACLAVPPADAFVFCGKAKGTAATKVVTIRETGCKKAEVNVTGTLLGALTPAKGDKGDTGATGPQGEKGDAGDQGPPGLVQVWTSGHTSAHSADPVSLAALATPIGITIASLSVPVGHRYMFWANGDVYNPAAATGTIVRCIIAVDGADDVVTTSGSATPPTNTATISLSVDPGQAATFAMHGQRTVVAEASGTVALICSRDVVSLLPPFTYVENYTLSAIEVDEVSSQ